MMINLLIWFGVLLAGLWIGIYLLDRYYNLESHNISLSPGLLIWRTKHGLSYLDRLSNLSRRGWKVFGLFAAVAGVIFMFLVTFGLVSNVFFFLTVEEAAGGGGAYLAIPGVTIPIIGGVIALATVILIHEPAHGVVLRNLGLQAKSTGLLLLLVIPGAFVEEDEEEFKDAPVSERLRVAGAGPVANVLFGLICLGLVLALIHPVSGIFISGVRENTPASGAHLQPGLRIESINHNPISDLGEFQDFMDNTKPGDEIVLRTEENQYQITLARDERDNSGYLGVYTTQSYSRSVFLHPLSMQVLIYREISGHPIINQYTYESSIPWSLITILKWIFALNIGVGLINLLPIGPLDGGHITRGIIEKFSSRSSAEKATSIITVLMLFVLLVNLFPQILG